MKKYILIALVIGLAHSTASAQMSVFKIDWNVGVPMGDMKDFIENESYRGIRIGGRAWIYDELSVGGEAGWQVFNGKWRGTQNVNGNIDASGTQFRYMNIYPVMANIHYYLGEDGGMRPYLGTNAGVTFINTRTEFGLWAVSETSTHFSVAPEIGAFIPVGVAGAGLNIGARYDVAFKTSKLDMNVQSFSFFLGFIFLN
ncbi:hypothetical protein [Reichenbachiella sp.]|uniref:hypothetical protein n=1 Tax=Reichenbachiella sp. TaxID=2184521 RepID=UPI003B5B8791